ncbi:hypothetical protein PHLCEN_2v4785 [Hermanssonia centrifuga]|uniref:Uncharacterized protein n=1 Tax=Hermanssonia centrifuga TaxID=98765 RepID=A0A2R6PJW2_9APHY|nr:hypothetical protein PHLCEN_2v4785 [Hermanssonia centrifuga]
MQLREKRAVNVDVKQPLYTIEWVVQSSSPQYLLADGHKNAQGAKARRTGTSNNTRPVRRYLPLF